MIAALLIAAIFGLPGLGLLIFGELMAHDAAAAKREVDRCRNLFHHHWGTRYCVTFYREFRSALDRHYSLDLWASVSLNLGWVLVLFGVAVLVVALLTQIT